MIGQPEGQTALFSCQVELDRWPAFAKASARLIGRLFCAQGDQRIHLGGTPRERRTGVDEQLHRFFTGLPRRWTAAPRNVIFSI